LVTGTKVPTGLIDTHADICGLAIESNFNFTTVGVDAARFICVAGLAQNIPGETVGLLTHSIKILEIARFKLAGNHDELVGKQSLAGYASVGISLEECIEDAVGNAVCKLVGMALRDRLRGKQSITDDHLKCPFLLAAFGDMPGAASWMQIPPFSSLNRPRLPNAIAHAALMVRGLLR
jgi:hypothetical protein